METLLGQQESLKSAEAVTRRVVNEARRAFEGIVDEPALEEAARLAVTELWRDSIKVTTFVPVLAMRRIREIIGTPDRASIGTGSGR